jgi:hypothetical protein
MKQTPQDPESQFSELLAQFDEALATASDSSSVASQPFISNLADADLQRRFDKVHNCLQLLEQDRRRQTANTSKDKSAQEQAAVSPQIGRFRVIRRLGSGGFGVVFLLKIRCFEDPWRLSCRWLRSSSRRNCTIGFCGNVERLQCSTIRASSGCWSRAMFTGFLIRWRNLLMANA